MKITSELLRNSPPLKRFTVGNDHNVFLLDGKNGKCVLKQYRFKTPNAVNSEALFMSFLFKNGCRVPKLLSGNKRGFYFFWKKGPSILMEYLPGYLLINRKISSGLLSEIGEELGRIDKNSESFSEKFSFNPNANKIVNSILKPHPLFYHSSFNKFLKLFDGMENIATMLIRKYENNIKIIRRWPSIIIHNDISEKNIIVNNNRLSGFIDFSDLIKAPFLYNVATASAHLCFQDNHWQENIKAFINSYRKSFKCHLWQSGIALLPFLMRYRLLSEMATNFYLGPIMKKARNTSFTNQVLWNKLKILTAIPENSIYEVIRNGY